MPDAGVASVHLSNATAAPLSVWLEPWVDQFILAPRSKLALHVTMPNGHEERWPEIECTDAMLTVYGPGESLIHVEIDGVAQDSCSASIIAPDLGPLTTRSFVDIVFGDFPEARAGGKPSPWAKRHGWLSRWIGRR